MSDETLALIIDTGSAVTKAGFAGSETPKIRFPTIVAIDGNQESDDPLVGNGVFEKLEKFNSNKSEELTNFDVFRPIQHGIVRNWALAESVWRHTFSNELKISQEEHPVLLTEPPLTPKLHRELCCQLFFESFGVPALYLATTSLLSMYGSSKTSGLVLDIGEGVAHSVLIHEGCIMPYAITRLDMGGFDLTSQIVKAVEPLRGNTAYDRRLAKDIKERCCRVSLDFDAELAEIDKDPDAHAKSFKLPDGTTVSLSRECITCPEILFKPELSSRSCPNLPEICYHSVRMCEPELHRTMFSNILLTGGSSMFDGFLERCEREISALVNKNVPVKVLSCSHQRDLSAWVGASIVANLQSFQQMWVTKEEYDEAGPTVIHRKCF
ncbi:actin ii, putative [Theileria annulata]|uniref:Actin ii, putative n=1 Tax=Theileria annulata TaxID=5874 RepID=Q4UDC1_THEAN|nr:actin ii, putative [Theileria annulata]CAI74918.1 actin ii, putative [Theileria annulata]|eukprot:XP_952650.1 actin ii, putative [Theileria annulata]